MIVIEMGQERTGWGHERNGLSQIWDLLGGADGGGGGRYPSGPYHFGPCPFGRAMSFVGAADGADDDTSSHHDRLRTQPWSQAGHAWESHLNPPA